MVGVGVPSCVSGVAVSWLPGRQLVKEKRVRNKGGRVFKSLFISRFMSAL
jgi:hypothetical protein